MAFLLGSHGGLLDDELARLGLQAHEVLDFSTNINPYGPAPEVIAAVRAAPIDRYPDPTAAAARHALAESLGVDGDEIVLGNGAAELLWSLARVLLAPGSRALVCEPTFSEFGRAAAASGARLCAWRADPRDDFALDLQAVDRRAGEESAAAVYLCNPNSPTGAAVPAAAIADLAASLAASAAKTTLVLDQSFLSLSEHHRDLTVRLPDNVVCVRSLTKDHALAGLRLGYAIVPAALARAVEASRPPWTTSAAAQAAARRAAGAAAFVAVCRNRLCRDRTELAAALRRLGVYPMPSTAPFLLVRVPGSGGVVRQRLLTEHGILVRDCASFALPEFVRVAARPAPDRARLVDALAQVL